MTSRYCHLLFLRQLSNTITRNKLFWITNTFIYLMALFLITFPLCPKHANGYSEKGHATAAKWSLMVLEKADKNRQYEEVYLPFFSGADREVKVGGGGENGGGIKTLIQGAADEDFGVVDGNERSFRHYYDPKINKGVRFSNLFNVWLALDAAVRHPGLSDEAPAWEGLWVPGNYVARYSGAKEWARNGAGSQTLRTWQGAIEAYDYSDSSRQEAYWRLGHVVHLVADMAEPDHITNTPHGGSSFSLPKDFDKIRLPTGIKEILRKVIIWSDLPLEDLLPAEKMILQHLFKMEDTPHGKKLAGYEWVAEEGLNFHSPYANQPDKILKYKNFEDYFDKLADISKKTIQSPPVWVSGEPFKVPLGLIGIIDPGKRYAPSGLTLESFQLGAEILAQIPAIDLNDTAEVARYRRLASYLISCSAPFNAGLIQWYHDIINPPPFVRKVTLKQRGRTYYESEWINSSWSDEEGVHDRQPSEKYKYTYQYKILDGRTQKTYVNKMLRADVPTEIIIEFGPRYGPPKVSSDPSSAPLLHSPERIREDSIQVEIGDKRVKGSLYRTGGIWTGHFTPVVPEDRPDWLYNIEIKAKDVHYHQPSRLVNPWTKIDGMEESNLDTEPGSPARVKIDSPYNWKGYEPGNDRSHQIKVHSSIATVDILSIKPLSDNLKELNVKHFHNLGEAILSSQGASELTPSYTHLTTPMKIKAGERISLELEYAVYANPLQEVSVRIAPSISGWLHWSGKEKPDPIIMMPVVKRLRMGENQTEKVERIVISMPMPYPTGDDQRSNFHDLILEVSVNGLNDHPLILFDAFDVQGPVESLDNIPKIQPKIPRTYA
ncbi:MAG: hypothetical protein KKE44_04775 [Proteobacteria bacterium]|nr:hypothetical protein [Pseudomonadota bacterium]MBU1582046.1 hypothetical protein [Pseudomonadota bacterium]MBU2626980.1 hypothetical protein [Pseudomonadota bacterium]